MTFDGALKAESVRIASIFRARGESCGTDAAWDSFEADLVGALMTLHQSALSLLDRTTEVDPALRRFLEAGIPTWKLEPHGREAIREERRA